MTHDWPAFVRAHLSASDRDLDPEILDELAAHVADLYGEAVASGRSEHDALAIARAALPSEAGRLAHEITRARRSAADRVVSRWTAAPEPPPARAGSMTRLLAGARRDLVEAMRALRRVPGYALVVILTLALGIGAVSTIFATIDTVLLRPLPYAGADRIVVPVSVNAARGIESASVSYADHVDWQRETSIFAAVALWRPVNADLTGAGQPERIGVAQVSRDFFQVIPVTPIAGRTLSRADHEPAAPRVAAISEGLWRGTFGAAADVIGRTARIGGVPVEIVGVLPARSAWPPQADAVMPLPAFTDTDVLTRRDNLIFGGIARLHDGVSIEAGTAVVETIAASLASQFPASRTGWTNRLMPLRDDMVEADLARALWILGAAIGAVLLIGCANLAHLGLVRGLGRGRELGIRVALGASRWRLVRQLATESLLLAMGGAAGGAVLTAWGIQGVRTLAPAEMPLLEGLALDVRVLGGVTAITGIVVLLAGVLPALAIARLAPGSALREGSPGAGWSRRIGRLRQGLVVAELAAAVVLMCGAGLLLQSFWRLIRVDPGVDVDQVLIARLTLPRADRYATAAQSAAFFAQLTDRLTATRDVEMAAATSYVPAGGGGFGLGRVFLPEGRPEPPAAPDVQALWNVVTPDYFETIGIPVLQGRSFTRSDRAGSTPVIIVSRSFAAQMFGGENPIGRRIRSWRDENLLREIVGVAGEVRYNGLHERERLRQVYVPHAQNSWGSMNVVLRASGDPAALEPLLRREVRRLDADLAVSNVSRLRDAARESIAAERYAALLLSAFAVTAVALGAIGVYGAVSHAVSARRRELAVRAALGAAPRTLGRLVFTQALRFAACGVALGLFAAAAAGRALQSLLYETSVGDPLAYVAATAAIVVSALLACLAPARRAAAADPLTALRAE